jgi:hypothetical protein
VEFKSKPSRHREVTPRANGLSTLWKGMKNVKKLRQIFQFEDQTKGTAKCGKRRGGYYDPPREKYLQGYPHRAKQKMEHLPGTTAKQIGDKHREPSYNFRTTRQHILEFRK